MRRNREQRTEHLQSIYVCVYGGGLVSKSCPTLVTPWTEEPDRLQSMGFPRQEYWSGLIFPSPGDLPYPGIEPRSPTLQADSLPSEPPGKPNTILLIIGGEYGTHHHLFRKPYHHFKDRCFPAELYSRIIMRKLRFKIILINFAILII